MSLSDALRAAALERAKKSGQTVDGVVLEPSGVIDLNEMEQAHAREQAAAKPTLSQRVQEATTEPEERTLTQTSLWRRLRPSDGAAPAEPTVDLTTPDEPTVDLTEPDPETLESPTAFEELLPDAATPTAFEPIVIDLTDVDEDPNVFARNSGADTSFRAPGTDPRLVPQAQPEEAVPTAPCDHCGSMGHRDLFDVFSQTEYYSCSNCGHMWQSRRS